MEIEGSQHLSSFGPGRSGSHFAVMTEDGRLQLWDTVSGGLKREYKEQNHLSVQYTCLAWLAPPSPESDNSNNNNTRKKKKRKTNNNDNNNNNSDNNNNNSSNNNNASGNGGSSGGGGWGNGGSSNNDNKTYSRNNNNRRWGGDRDRPSADKSDSVEIYCGNLPTDVEENELRDLFQKYGRIERIKVIGRIQNNAKFAFNVQSHASPNSSTGPPLSLVGFDQSDSHVFPDEVASAMWTGRLNKLTCVSLFRFTNSNHNHHLTFFGFCHS